MLHVSEPMPPQWCMYYKSNVYSWKINFRVCETIAHIKQPIRKKKIASSHVVSEMKGIVAEARLFAEAVCMQQTAACLQGIGPNSCMLCRALVPFGTICRVCLQSPPSMRFLPTNGLGSLQISFKNLSARSRMKRWEEGALSQMMQSELLIILAALL